MNPGSLKWLPGGVAAKAITAEVTPKVMIKKTTMT